MKIDLADMDTVSWRRDLEHDAAVIAQLLEELAAVTPHHDSKLQLIRSQIDEKLAAPINAGNRKVLIFSAFADTANYLYRELSPELANAGMATAVVTGSSSPSTTLGKGFTFQQLLTMFSPRSKSRALVMPDEEREVDILIGTDCILSLIHI